MGTQTHIPGEPNLLVAWEPRWPGFVASVRTMARRCRAPHIPFVPVGIAPRSPLVLILFHLAAVLAVLSLDNHISPAWQALVASPAPVRLERYSGSLVYLNPSLPEMDDVRGAQEGRKGAADRREAYHPTQVIRIARENRLTRTVVDAPTLRLPNASGPVANLIALPAPPPPPVRDLPLRRRLQHASVDVAPPPPQVEHRNLRSALTAPAVAVVPPAPAVPAPRLAALPMSQASVVPPPPAAEQAKASRALTIAPSDVVPPPPAPDQARGLRAAAPAAHTEVVPPPPSPELRSARALQPSATAVLPPAPESPRPAGEVVVSTASGDGVGVPAGKPGSVSMSPAGSKLQVPRTLPGPELAGVHPGDERRGAPGTGTSGNGLGADQNARGGITLQPGPGGAGPGNGQKMAAGVAISGGVVRLPSFGSGKSAQPSLAPQPKPTGLVVVASAGAGGALARHLAAQGGRVYTIYLATSIGTAVLQYVDPKAGATFAPDLAPPEPIDVGLPADLQVARVVLSATIDREGMLRQVQVLQADKPDLTSRLIAALQRWRFRPVHRQDVAVEVSAVLGFGLSRQ